MAGYVKIADREDVEASESRNLLQRNSNRENSKNARLYLYPQLGLWLVLFCLVAAFMFNRQHSPAAFETLKDVSKGDISSFDAHNRFLMRNFDKLKPMSNFLAGLGGLWGVPLWTFYVNRGQGIAAFGLQNKDGAIMKFNTAEKTYQLAPFIGFRTFLKGRRGKEYFTSQPFFPTSDDPGPDRTMKIGTNELEIEEIDRNTNVQTNVLYFSVPNENFAALVRQTTFTNLDTKKELDLDVLDGLARLLPAGLSNANIDTIGRTMEAWMNVYNLHPDDTSQPFYHISQSTADTAQVQVIKEGHFVLSFIEDDESNELHSLLPFVVDPNVVFDTDTTLTNPTVFFNTPLPKLLKSPQGTTSRTPCAFAGAALVIPPMKNVTITSVYGHSDTLSIYLTQFRDKIRIKGFAAAKRKEATEVAKTITDLVVTETSSALFDMYTQQSLLDNVLRGGLPLPLGDPEKPKIFHVFSRIHGDLERDYNNFQIDTTPYSQGPGNFRDVNQNRRLDVLLNPIVGDFNVRMFLAFVQADGFNPLTVAGTNFKIPADSVLDLVASLKITAKQQDLVQLFSKAFRPGQLFKDISSAGIKSTLSKDEMLVKIISAADQVYAGAFNQNGFWADHWTYTLDLVDNYVSVFPEKEQYMLYDSDPVPFFASPAIVKSRADRYILVNITGYNDSVVRVYNAIAISGDPLYPPERKLALSYITKDPKFVQDIYGQGGYWQQTVDRVTFAVSPVAKLFLLAVNKFSSLDPSGLGVEMEGGKPGWNDAMNGLPGLIGSGMPETYEMKRILDYIKTVSIKYGRSISLPTEFTTFLKSLLDSLAVYNTDGDDFAYWDASNDARETYRASVVANFTGVLEDLTADEVISAITLLQQKVEQGIARALATNGGLSPSYFYHEVVEYDTVVASPTITNAIARKFKLHTLPLFLEGPTRHMKVISNIDELRSVYQKTKDSNLYDAPLKMFKISESLKAMGQDVGRMMAFSPGWLENESIWLHMSYKFYLELLRASLFEEFFTEMETGLVPFMPNARYGRSPIEAASFIVSSAFPDTKFHGSSFLARLSGSTAEYLSMWAIIMAGKSPFILNSTGELSLSLKPAIAEWLFTKANTASFTFLSAVKVIYYNPKRIDTWKILPTAAYVTGADGVRTAVSNPVEFPADVSLKVRNLEIKIIEIFY